MTTKVTNDELIDFKKAKVRKSGGFGAVWSLFNTYWWRSGFGPFFTFGFPVIIYAILGSLMDAKLMFGGVVAMTTMSVGIQGLPWSVMELKQSVLLKRIGASPVKTYQFTLAIVAHTVLMTMVSVFWLMLWVLVLFRDPSIFEPMKHFVSFAGFMYGIGISIILSVSIGFALAAISKTETQASMYGMLIYMPATFLSGQFISIDVIAQNDVMNWISVLTPFRYPTMFIINAWTFPDMNAFAIQDVTWPVAMSIDELRALIDGGEGFIPGSTMKTWNDIGVTNLDTLFEVANDATHVHHGVISPFYVNGSFMLNSQILYTSQQVMVGHIYPLIFNVATIAFAAKTFKWSGSR